MTTIAEAAKFLNEIHQLDPTVLPALIDHRVQSNEAFAHDPDVQVGPDHEVGLMGILNGLLGRAELGGALLAVFDDDGVLTHFEGGPRV